MKLKKTLSVFLIFIFLTSCEDKVQLRKVEPPVCYPSEEVCNGVDDDCDGKIDEDTDVVCSSVCGSGVMACSKGALLPCSARMPEPNDFCNGKDDDCDGQIDEDIEITACYPRDNKELLYGECRFGINRCRSGAYTCMDWIGPEAEKCNGKDDDCDGQIDEGVSKVLDIILILDNSGSMCDNIAQLIDATAQWATKYNGRVDLRFSLTNAPDGDPDFDGKVLLKKNLSSAQDFTSILRQQITCDTALEPTLDAIFDVSTPSNPLNLTWAPGSKKVIIVYSDEPPQSYKFIPLSEQQALDEARNNNIPVYVFTEKITDWSMWNSQIFVQGLDLEKALDNIIADNSC